MSSFEAQSPTAPALEVRMFGEFAAYRGGASRVAFAYKKVAALFALLCVAQREYSRAQLEAMLWPDKSEEEAARNLRNALTMVRRVLRESAAEQALVASKKSVQLLPSAQVSVDLLQFTSQPIRAESAQIRMEALERALQLYSGPFMDGFHLPDCPAFEAWMQAQREQLHNEAVVACHELLGCYEAGRDGTNALRVAQRLAQLQPLDEPAHASMVYWMAHGGDRSGALQLYENYVEELAEELGTGPGSALKSLAESLRGWRLPEFSDHGAPRSTLRHDEAAVQVAAMYVHVIDIDEDPEATYEAMATIQAELHAEVVRVDGYSVRHPFGGLVACFHAPLGAGDLGQRVAACVVALRSIAARHPECRISSVVIVERAQGSPADGLDALVDRMGSRGFQFASRLGAPWCVADARAFELLSPHLPFADEPTDEVASPMRAVLC
jgi:DNA-binding SARP family transcriptional activator